MERHKLIYFKAFLQRTEACLKDLVFYVESILPDFKRCYSEFLTFSDDKLVKLILIDSGFIIQLFCGMSLFKPWLVGGISSDLLLLENQLPFFVNLIRIFHLQHPIECRPGRINLGVDKLVIYPPSATELLEAGVRFKVNTKSECLLGLRFSGGVLEIPQLTVDDGTEILFRNMVALEQCHYPDESYIIDYVAFLDFLINTSMDVDILVKSEILENWLADSDSVAKLFNGLCKNVMHSSVSSHFPTLGKDLNDFCKNPWHRLKATLRRDYCNTPWQTAASIAGIVLLVLTLLQSVCSVLQVVQAS
ncbi:hypothetical protein MtrunA17_Chr7g0218171 [Medicago truncatula]|uniref:DUF247 domain protein n=1 Tax=Medicago truncatula TaxID=3880 RepID=A0A396H097_MEDTR|nr:UPF0481 protein At3g47200 [Medicago truncatula]RHN44327.1 hypothetical protein MtrunA17_Chr7g0218171 [Medicago truncatula]